MIRLTGKIGHKIYINPNKIIGVYEDISNGGAYVNYGSDEYVVAESPEEVARKVLEWKLSMVRYQAAYAEAIKDKDADPEYVIDFEAQRLRKLAGLEGTE